jgi:hypothetical protein
MIRSEATPEAIQSNGISKEVRAFYWLGMYMFPCLKYLPYTLSISFDYNYLERCDNGY